MADREEGIPRYWIQEYAKQNMVELRHGVKIYREQIGAYGTDHAGLALMLAYIDALEKHCENIVSMAKCVAPETGTLRASNEARCQSMDIIFMCQHKGYFPSFATNFEKLAREWCDDDAGGYRQYFALNISDDAKLIAEFFSI